MSQSSHRTALGHVPPGPGSHHAMPSAPRFKDNPYVNGELGNIVFYAAAPLVTSLGHRLGSLCVVDYRPREFDAECCNMLANFAEIVVRDTERYTAALEELQVRILTSPCKAQLSTLLHAAWVAG